MDAFHNLLREATNPRNASAVGGAASSNGLPATGSLTQALQSAGGGAAMGMNPGMAMNGGTGLPMGMSLPMGMTTMSTANGSLAPIHRMSPLMGAGSPMFPSLNGAGGGMIMPGMTPPVTATSAAAASSAAASTATAASSAKEKPAKTNTKKRKAPATTASAASSNNGDAGSSEEGKQPEEYLDPKAKRRAQIAKAARKHRQRQKDELIALRAKVKDLKEQIEVLQSSEPSEHNTELGWKQEAEQHAEIRARVDQENEFLRKTLMEQMKFIQRLQDYFTKQPLLNMPSLDMILNSSSSSTTSPSALSNTIASASAPSMLQIQSSSFQDQLLELAREALSGSEKQLTQCEAAFRNPKTSTMTYFGLQVQYEMNKDEMGIFFRHHLYNCDAKVVMEDLWECIGDTTFEKNFPFMESSELLEEIDANIKYVRRVENLTISNDAHSGGTIKEESLTINQKQENADGSVFYISRTVRDDPTHPKSSDHIRRNKTTAASLRNFSDSTGSGCLLLWSVKVIVDKETDEREKNFNVPDIILKNLFEIAPVYVKAIVDRARGSIQQT